MRETKLSVTIAGKDVSADLGPALLSFGYDDVETDEADTLRFTLMDPDGRWAGSWRPQGGETVTAKITLLKDGGPAGTLDCGTFRADSMRASGRPRVVEIGAVSVPIDTPLRRLRKVRGFEKTTLRALAADIAGGGGLSLMWEAGGDGASYARVEQSDETDLAFLSRLCRDAGLSLKITDERLVVFDRETYESKAPVTTITESGGGVLGWDLSYEKGGEYARCTVSWRDPGQKTGGSAASYEEEGMTAGGGANPAVMTYTAEDPEIQDGQEFKIRKRCESRAEAEKLAKAKLRELNAGRITGSVTVPGDPALVAGVVVALEGFGAWDGDFFVERASHSVGSGGYTTGLSLRRVNTGIS